MIALEGLLAHGGDLAFDQRFEGLEQGIETGRRFEQVQRLGDGFDGRQGPGAGALRSR